ncbi:MAG: hypothetical protein OEU92_03115 [Alphaproteobacteria bacterium]|nr:hypothetical protein [Alphaproteobacteria bacterium]
MKSPGLITKARALAVIPGHVLQAVTPTIQMASVDGLDTEKGVLDRLEAMHKLLSNPAMGQDGAAIFNSSLQC